MLVKVENLGVERICHCLTLTYPPTVTTPEVLGLQTTTYLRYVLENADTPMIYAEIIGVSLTADFKPESSYGAGIDEIVVLYIK